MCGIVGIIGKQSSVDRIVDGLSRLEYRGYDSAGIATVHNGQLGVRRATGKLSALREELRNHPLEGRVGIGHTRWATHGIPSLENAHPHSNEYVTVVHNGIIENHEDLRRELIQKGWIFNSQTDTEVIAHAIGEAFKDSGSPHEAMKKALPKLRGAFAIAVLFKGVDDYIAVARDGASPLALGMGEGEVYLGSDAIAMAPLTDQVCYLEEGDWAELSPFGMKIYDRSGAVVERSIKKVITPSNVMDKGDYAHFMLKEIHEQSYVVGETVKHYREDAPGVVWKDVPRLTLSACGTAYYAAWVAKYWFESLARLPVDMDVASEFRYRTPPMTAGGMSLFVSQSGETADTMAACEYAKSQGQKILSVVNVGESSLCRASDHVVLTKAGVEVGVASTKAFTTQLSALAQLALDAAENRGTLSQDQVDALRLSLLAAPQMIEKFLTPAMVSSIETLAKKMAGARDVLYLGRGVSYPMAMEGALKLKEISYIHAEGYAAGEMKHGPIALIDESVPVVVIAPYDALIEKTASNAQEVASRGGKLIIMTDAKGREKFGAIAADYILMPETNMLTAPLLYALPVQLLAYYAAVAKGTDVDQPRNLAKSVTVE